MADRCEACGEDTVYVLESRSPPLRGSDEYVRHRRLECRSCKHRTSTKEIRNEFFTYLIARDKKLSIIEGLLSDLPQVDQPENLKPPCWSCQFNDRSKCHLGFSEFQTTEAHDCASYFKHKLKTVSPHESTNYSSTKLVS